MWINSKVCMCASPHSTEELSKPRNTDEKRASCGGLHFVSYSECRQFPQMQRPIINSRTTKPIAEKPTRKEWEIQHYLINISHPHLSKNNSRCRAIFPVWDCYHHLKYFFKFPIDLSAKIYLTSFFFSGKLSRNLSKYFFKYLSLLSGTQNKVLLCSKLT